jgi:hypothetical protein
MIAAAMIFQMAAPDREWARLLTIGLQGLVVLVSLSAAGADVRLMHAASLAIFGLLAISVITLLGIGGIGPAAPRAVSLGLVLLAPTGIAIGLRRELREDRRVTIQTVYGGLCLYLLIGLAFAFAFNLVQDLGSPPFFEGAVSGDSSEFLYFSLATLTTTGYGDFAAATELGRTLAVTEALVGQIYMVTVVALLVSNLGRTASGELSEQARARLAGDRTPVAEEDPST